MNWISRTLRWFRQPHPTIPTVPTVPTVPTQPSVAREAVPGYAPVLPLLARIGAPVGDPPSLRYAFLSADQRFWSVTLENLHSYLIDTERLAYLHYPNASADGFAGAVAIMIPDAIRFSLGPYDEEPLEVALDQPQPWIELPTV